MKRKSIFITIIFVVAFSGLVSASTFNRTPPSFYDSLFNITGVQVKCDDAGQYYLKIYGEKVPGGCTTPGCEPPAVYVGAETLIELYSLSVDTAKGEIIAYFPEGTLLYPGCYTLFVVDKFDGRENPSRKDTFVFCTDFIQVGGGE